MGLLASLLPGLRDLRTPLTSGYVWMLGLWLLLSDLSAVREVAQGISSAIDPLASTYGVAAAIGATSIAAYLLGSLVTGKTSTVRLNVADWLLAYPVRDVPHLGAKLPGATQGREDPFIDQLARHRRLRTADIFRLEDFYFPQSGIIVTESPGNGWTKARPRTERTWMLMSDAERSMSPEISEWERDGLIIDNRQRERFIDRLDAQSASVRLLIKNRELWDQYDRLNSEAELRLTLAFPLLTLAAGVAWQGAWWAGVVVLILAWGLYRDGDARARAANSVLVAAIVTGVIADPALEGLASRILQERGLPTADPTSDADHAEPGVTPAPHQRQ